MGPQPPEPLTDDQVAQIARGILAIAAATQTSVWVLAADVLDDLCYWSRFASMHDLSDRVKAALRARLESEVRA